MTKLSLDEHRALALALRKIPHEFYNTYPSGKHKKVSLTFRKMHSARKALTGLTIALEDLCIKQHPDNRFFIYGHGDALIAEGLTGDALFERLRDLGTAIASRVPPVVTAAYAKCETALRELEEAIARRPEDVRADWEEKQRQSEELHRFHAWFDALPEQEQERLRHTHEAEEMFRAHEAAREGGVR
jgi:hypothetical protein